MTKIVEIEQCSYCPWLKWGKLEPKCGHPDTLDNGVKDALEIPEWCPLDELVGVGDE